MTWIANMLWMKLTQLCVSLKAFPKEEGAFVHVQILLCFFIPRSEIVWKVLNQLSISISISKRPIANMVLTNSSIHQIISQSLLVSQILCLLKKHTGLFIKFDYGHSKKYFYFWLWKLFISNNRIVWSLSIMKFRCSNSKSEF